MFVYSQHIGPSESLPTVSNLFSKEIDVVTIILMAISYKQSVNNVPENRAMKWVHYSSFPIVLYDDTEYEYT